MRDDDASVRDVGSHVGKHRRDVLVRKAVEAITLYAPGADVARQGNDFGDGRLSAVKARVEAGDLRDTGSRSATASIAARLCG